MNLEIINSSLKAHFLGGLLMLGYNEPPTRRGEISWIHYSPKSETLLVQVCYLAEEDAMKDYSWQRLVDYPYMFKFKIKENLLAKSLSSLDSGKQISIVMPDDDQKSEQIVEIFTLINPWIITGLVDFNSTTH